MRLPGAVDLGVRPERGLDLSTASFEGIPFAWTSAVGEVPGSPGDWWGSWGGGLMTTAGLDNVGAPSEGYPLHGTYTYLAAREVEVDGGEVRGVVEDGRGLLVERRIRNGADRGLVELEDTTTNTADEPLEALVLYHCNLLWGRPAIDSARVEPRDADAAAQPWDALGAGAERVYEHTGASRTVALTQGLRVTIRSSLPRLWQWVDPPLGVLGIEPANCSVLGRAHDRAEGRLPLLAPGEARVSTLTIEVEAA